MQYSNDNGITWHTIKLVDPTVMDEGTLEVTIELPSEAKGSYVMFKWWQSLISSGNDSNLSQLRVHAGTEF